MKPTGPFSVIFATHSKAHPPIPDEDFKLQNIEVTSINEVDVFEALIKNKRFDLIFICLDGDAPFTEKTVEHIRLSKKNIDTPIVISTHKAVEKHSLQNFYDSGADEVFFGSDCPGHLLGRVLFYRQLSIKTSRLLGENNKLKKQNSDLKKINQQLIRVSEQDRKKLQKVYKELSEEILENIRSMFDLNERGRLLSARIKELNCLISIAKHSEEDNITMEAFFKHVVNNLVSTFNHPEKVSAEIKYSDQFFRSDDFVKTKVVISHEIGYQKTTLGTISLYYNSRETSNSSTVFTEEKKQLLSTIANNLGLITHRKEMERRLKIFQRAVDQSPLMISFTNVKTQKIEFINPMFSKVFGLSQDDLIKKNPFLKPTDKMTGAIRKKMARAISEGKIWKGSYQSKTIDGKSFWQRTSLYPLFEGGKITHTLGISEDITHEIRTAEELKISKENYEHIANNVPGGIIIFNKDGNVLYANKQAAKITGYTVHELGKLKLQDLSYSDEYPKLKERLKNRLKGEYLPNNYETLIKTKQGEILNVISSGSRTKWMGEAADLITFNDISRQKRFAELLNIQGNIDYLGSIPIGLNSSFQKIFEVLFTYRWIDCGRIYVMNKRRSGLNLLFQKGHSTNFVNNNQFVSVKSKRFKLLEQKEAQYFILNKSEIYSEKLTEEGMEMLMVFPLIHNDLIIGVLNIGSKTKLDLSENEKMIFESISTRIAQMMALVSTQEELQHKNQELQQILVDVREKQQLLIQKSKLESLGEMAAGVAHEINQPLGVIFLSLENILFKIADQNISQKYLDKKLTSISDNIKKIKEIIDHIRIFSRDQKSIILKRVDVNDVIQKACKMIEEQYIYHQIAIDLKLAKNVGHTLGNSHKLEQILHNLLSNAKFALIEKEAVTTNPSFVKEIQISTFSNDGKIIIEFRDNGIGIEEGQIDHIFNPFFTTKPEGEGTGLGLSIVYGIISEMKGAIEIQSIRQQYTLVRIELPKYTLKS